MKFKKLVPEAGNCKHWNPSQKGEWIEGYVKDYIKDGFDNDQILLDRGVDKNGNEIETTIPTHYNLQQYYSQIEIIAVNHFFLTNFYFVIYSSVD